MQRLMDGKPLSSAELEALAQMTGLNDTDNLHYQNWMAQRMLQALAHPEVQEALRELLEQLAQAGTGRLPHDQVCVEITILDAVSTETVTPSDIPAWDAADRLASRAFGDRWLAEQRSCVLLTPSVIVPTELNVVVNPEHADFAGVTASTPRALNWDERLKAFAARRPV